MTTIGTLFSGGEGVGVGAHTAGLRHAWGVEYDDAIAGVARTNGFDIITASVLDVDYAALPRVDVLHASPPCPNFSVAKTGRGETAHDLALADAVCRAIRAQRPRIFTLENVRGYAGSESLRRIVATLADLDYSIDQWVLNAADFGVPQTRERLVLVARSGGWMRAPLLLPRPVPWVGWYAAIEDLLPTLPESKLAEWQLKRLPEELRDSVLLAGGNTSHEIAHRVSSAPSWTLTARSEAMRAFIVNGTSSVEVRDATGRVVAMTPRCLARFQSFPDTYALPERVGVACRVLGNAVPPLLYQRVVEAALEQTP